MKKLKIFSWNVNGIRSVISKGAIQEFVAKYNPDILCLQETKAEKQELPIDFTEYMEVWNSAKKKGYAGTAIFTKINPISTTENLSADIVNKFELTPDRYGDPNDEGRVITTEFESFFLVTVYTPNAKEDLSRIPLRQKNWDPAFLYHCKTLEKKKPVILCGDLNVAHKEIDLARPKENAGKKGFTLEERGGFDELLKAGYVDTLRIFKNEAGLYTWWSNWGGARARNVGWRIDYFLVSNSIAKNIASAKIHPEVMGSDHCPVSIEIEI